MSVTPTDGKILDFTPLVKGDLGAPEEVTLPREGAEKTALVMGLIKPDEVIGDPKRLPGGQLLPCIRGRKALVGQYKQKYQREDGTIGYLDMSEVINATRGAVRLPI